MSNEKKMTESKMWVRRHYKRVGKEIGDDYDETRLAVDVFETEPAQASCSMGMTINLGNYESLRVEVGVVLPCYKEEVEEAQQRCFDLVENELYKKVREAKEAL